MKRRGFLGSLVTLVAASTLPGKAEEKPLIRLETLPADSPLVAKAKSNFMASGWVSPQDGEMNFNRDSGKMRIYSSQHDRWFDIER